MAFRICKTYELRRRETAYELISYLENESNAKTEYFDAKIPLALALKNPTVMSKTSRENANFMVSKKGDKKIVDIVITKYRYPNICVRVFTKNLTKAELFPIIKSIKRLSGRDASIRSGSIIGPAGSPSLIGVFSKIRKGIKKRK